MKNRELTPEELEAAEKIMRQVDKAKGAGLNKELIQLCWDHVKASEADGRPRASAVYEVVLALSKTIGVIGAMCVDTPGHEPLVKVVEESLRDALGWARKEIDDITSRKEGADGAEAATGTGGTWRIWKRQ